MIEKIVCDYIKGKLDVDAYPEEPTEAPIRYVLVEKTDSNVRNFIYHTTLSIASYDESMFRAAELDTGIRDILSDIIENDEVVGIHITSSFVDTDTETKNYRYRTVVEITHY